MPNEASTVIVKEPDVGATLRFLLAATAVPLVKITTEFESTKLLVTVREVAPEAKLTDPAIALIV